MIISHQGLF